MKTTVAKNNNKRTESLDEDCIYNIPAFGGMFGTEQIHLGDLKRHSIFIGETGSGKTYSGVMPFMKVLCDHPENAVLLIDPKKNELLGYLEKAMTKKMFDKRVITVSRLNGSKRIDFFEYERKSNASIRKRIEKLLHVSTAHSIISESSTNREWMEYSKRFLFNVVELDSDLRACMGKSLWDILRESGHIKTDSESYFEIMMEFVQRAKHSKTDLKEMLDYVKTAVDERDSSKANESLSMYARTAQTLAPIMQYVRDAIAGRKPNMEIIPYSEDVPLVQRFMDKVNNDDSAVDDYEKLERETSFFLKFDNLTKLTLAAGVKAFGESLGQLAESASDTSSSWARDLLKSYADRILSGECDDNEAVVIYERLAQAMHKLGLISGVGRSILNLDFQESSDNASGKTKEHKNYAASVEGRLILSHLLRLNDRNELTTLADYEYVLDRIDEEKDLLRAIMEIHHNCIFSEVLYDCDGSWEADRKASTSIEASLGEIQSYANLENNQRFHDIVLGIEPLLAELSDPVFTKVFWVDPLSQHNDALSIRNDVIMGKKILAYAPDSSWTIGTMVGRALKTLFFQGTFETYEQQQRRFPVFYICDEFQRFITSDPESGEQSFLDRCRAFQAVCVLATQSLASLRYAVLNDQRNHAAAVEAVEIMLNNIGNKFFFRTTDRSTHDWLQTVVPVPPQCGVPHILSVRPPSTLSLGECYYLVSKDGRWGRRQIVVQ